LADQGDLEFQESSEDPNSEPKESQPSTDATAERIAALEATIHRLEGRLSAPPPQAAPPAPEPVKTFSREELQQMVDVGTITESERDRRLDEQRQVEYEQKMAEKLEAMKGDLRVEGQIQALCDQYPDLLDDSTELAQKAGNEFRYLHSIGLPPTLATKLAAIRKVCPETKTKVRETTREKRPTHEESGGTGAGGGKTAAWGKGLPQEIVTHYQWQLDQGQFPGGVKNEDFQKEIEIARSRVH